MKSGHKNKMFSFYAFGIAMIILLGAGGCRSASIRVLDAETKTPIPCATVNVFNQDIITIWPREKRYETDKKGKAKVQTTGLLRVSVQKEDYKEVSFMIRGKDYLTFTVPETVTQTVDGVTVYLPRSVP